MLIVRVYYAAFLNIFTMATQSKPLADLDTLFKSSGDVYKKRFWRLIGVTVAPFIIIVILMAILFGAAIVTTGGLDAENASESLQTTGAIAIIVVVAVIAVVSILANIALMLAVSDKEASVMGYFKMALPFFWGYTAVAIMMGVAVIFGFILLIIPGIIFAVWFSQALYVRVFENIGSFDAMKRSKAYVKGRWWGVVGRYLVIGIFSLIVSLVSQLIGAGFVESEIAALVVLGVIITYVGPILFAPFNAAYQYHLYTTLRDTYESPTATQEATS